MNQIERWKKIETSAEWVANVVHGVGKDAATPTSAEQDDAFQSLTDALSITPAPEREVGDLPLILSNVIVKSRGATTGYHDSEYTNEGAKWYQQNSDDMDVLAKFIQEREQAAKAAVDEAGLVRFATDREWVSAISSEDIEIRSRVMDRLNAGREQATLAPGEVDDA